jgi:hypothetical protein
MKKLVLGAAIFSLSLLANAQTADVTVTAGKEVPASEEVNITADKKVVVVRADCVRETGSRIKSKKDKKGCNGLPGRSYGKDELDSTGEINVSDALGRLDPSIQIRRY